MQIVVMGGCGNDTIGLGAMPAAIRIEGGDGDDELAMSPTQAPQLVDAGPGNDTLRVTGEPGALTTVLGGDGDDELNLQAGNATVDAGAGADRVVVGGPAARHTTSRATTATTRCSSRGLPRIGSTVAPGTTPST